jgi:hypothetical protein
MRNIRYWALVMAVAVVGVAGGCSHKSTSATAPTQRQVVHIHRSVNSPDPSLTNDQVLSSLVGPPYVLGFVKGVITGQGVSVEVRRTPQAKGVAYTDFPLKVVAFIGPAVSPYAIGSTIALRVPGGTSGDTITIDDAAPTVTNGQLVYILDRNQGDIGGGNTADRIVASLAGQDVFYDNAGIVTGQGRFSRDKWSQSEAAFEAHFKKS